MSQTLASVTAKTQIRTARKAVLGAQVGLFIDMFDVYLPIIALAPAAAYFEPTGVDASASRVITALIFVATLLGRPLGALVFGHVSDVYGRRRTTLISLVGFGVCTLAIGAMPGYAQIGMAGVVILIVLRFLDGGFLGGQYTAAAPLAMEQSPKERRGFYGALIMTGFPIAYCVIALLTTVLLVFIPAGSPAAPYVQWGWRIPFFAGGLFAFIWAAWYARNVEESRAFIAEKKGEDTRTKRTSPVVELFRGDNLRGFIQVFVLMSGIWLAFNMIGAVLPGMLRTQAHLSDIQSTLILVVAYAALIVTYLLCGALSQRIGRRPFFLMQGVLTTVIAPILFWMIVTGRVRGMVGIGILTVLLVIVVVSTYAVVTTYINERFRIGVRSSGYGLGYTVAVIIPSFYAFFQLGLQNLMPFEYTPLVLIVIGGLLIFTGAAIGPETKHADLSAAVATETGPADTISLSGSIAGMPYSAASHSETTAYTAARRTHNRKASHD